jgi:hypothetical protein
MITNEIRNANGTFKELPLTIQKDIDKSIKRIYKKHKGKISYDLLHLIVCDSSNFERVMTIALTAK